VNTVRITLKIPREEVLHWSSMAAFSVLLHAAVLAAVVFLPRFLDPAPRFPDVYTADLVSLPAGLPGIPREGPRASAPPKPAPAPAKPAPAVKIPERPEAKAPKAKTATKREPPKVERTEPKPEPAASMPAPAEAAAAPGAEAAGGEGGAGGLAGGSGGGGGGSGFLDDATFQYAWYLSNMTSIFGRNWARPIKPDLDRTLRAVVYFQVLKDGTLANIVLEQSSGDPILDRSALRAVQDSNPLPPLPYQYGKDSLGVHFFFDLKPD
jgi:TonB family protein